MGTWSTTTIATTTDIAKFEAEILNLTSAGDTTYLMEDVSIAVDSPVCVSIDVSDGKGTIEIIGVAETELTIASAEILQFIPQDSGDDITYADVADGNKAYYHKGLPSTIAADTELFRYVVPTISEDYLNFSCDSDSTNAGTVSIYASAKWTNKYDVAKDLLKTQIELRLLQDGYGKYIDYDDDEVPIDIIFNPEVFKYTMCFYWLSLIYDDLSNGNDDSVYGQKAIMYRERAEFEFNREYSLKNLDIDQDGDADEHDVRSTPTITVSM
jgi:hypothetical protein